MNANTLGKVLVSSDHINERIDDFAKHFLRLEKHKDTDYISKEDFLDFVKSIHLIVTNELSRKGAERKWTD